MATARETAREASYRANDVPLRYDGDRIRNASDAASDVWEPLLREAYEYIGRVIGSRPEGLARKLKEALGDNT